MPPKKAKKTTLIHPKKTVPDLPEHTDFYDLFGATNDGAGGKFSDIIEENLANEKIAAALKEKNDAIKIAHSNTKQTKKYPPPQSVLDLHGYTAKEAEGKTTSYVRDAEKNGLQSLLIITGKGLHSAGEGILRDVVEAILIELKKQNVILSFKWEKKHKHKSGALYVYLA